MSEDNSDYFNSTLTSVGASGIWNEKSRLKHHRDRLESHGKELAFEHYPTFISSAECSTQIARQFADNQRGVADLEDKIPRLRDLCHKFQSRSSEVSAQRKRTSLVLSRHTKLLEFLELPQLMETCVRNAKYEEALEIQQLAAKVAKPPKGDIRIVSKVVEDIRTSSEWMLNQLLARLRTQITLPECLKVVGLVRRMAAFSETELRIKFLQAREQHFDSVLKSASASVDSGDVYASLSRITEVTRVSVFDTITQYRALFSDDDIALPLVGSADPLSHVSYRQIFSAWIFRRIHMFKAAIEEKLKKNPVEEQSLDSLVGQIMYFGQSLGRVGFDFRPQFVPIFTTLTLAKCDQHLKDGLNNFETSLKSFSLPTSNVTPNVSLTDNQNLEPPSSLMTHYPIAELSNGVAMTLNELRYSAPVFASVKIFDKIQEVISAAAASLVLHDRRAVGCESEVKIAHSLIRCFCKDFLPYVTRCYKNIFPDNVLSKADFSVKGMKREFTAKDLAERLESFEIHIPKQDIPSEDVKAEQATSEPPDAPEQNSEAVSNPRDEIGENQPEEKGEDMGD